MPGFLFGGGAGTTVTATGGTTARSLSDRAADIVNVKDYEATGNGVTIDLSAIQAAVDSLGVNGGIVYFPPGTYLINGPIKLNNAGDNKSIVLLGCGNASQITGNFAGYLIDKGAITVATSASTATSNGTLHFADTSTIVVHSQIINLTNPSSLPSAVVAAKTSTTVTMTGVVDGSAVVAASTINSGDVIEFAASEGGSTQYVRKISQLYLNNTNAAGGCIRLIGSWPAQVRDCYLTGFIGITADNNSAVDVSNCKLSGIGGAGGYGISVGGECTVYKCDITSFGSDAIRAYGAAGSIIGNRCELNGGWGVALGVKANGAWDSAQGWSVSGNSCEGNGGGLFGRSISACTIVGNLIHGEDVNGSTAGMLIKANSSACLIAGLSCYGDFGAASSNPSIELEAPLPGFVIQGVTSFISTSGHGVAWKVADGHCAQMLGCNFTPSSQTIANAPTASARDGDLWTFTNANTSTLNADIVAAGTGTTRAVGRYSATDGKWYYVAKG